MSRSRKIAVPCETSRSSRTISVVPPRVRTYLGFTGAALTMTETVGIFGSRPSVQLSHTHNASINQRHQSLAQAGARSYRCTSKQTLLKGHLNVNLLGLCPLVQLSDTWTRQNVSGQNFYSCSQLKRHHWQVQQATMRICAMTIYRTNFDFNLINCKTNKSFEHVLPPAGLWLLKNFLPVHTDTKLTANKLDFITDILPNTTNDLNL